jgi:hypothetical protein
MIFGWNIHAFQVGSSQDNNPVFIGNPFFASAFTSSNLISGINALKYSYHFQSPELVLRSSENFAYILQRN